MQSKILTSVSYKAPSDLPKSGGAAAPPAPPFAAPLISSYYSQYSELRIGMIRTNLVCEEACQLMVFEFQNLKV